ncbi:rRNA N6-adenosine-methyltransferase METTL5 [Nematocida sp. AWRm80]|nr:rRNA N6-adenosine-methyltransferase METTL5 [Nematocida sp. AWRm80]
MKLKEAKWILDSVKEFPVPKIKYEQYTTPSELAAAIAHMMHLEKNDIENKHILDVGCGTGMLCCALSLYGPKKITGLEIDSSLETLFFSNLSNVSSVSNLPPVKTLFLNVNILEDEDQSKIPNADVAIINPPFGTKNNKGIDIQFLEIALSKAPIVYSMHKSSTREYIQRRYKDKVQILSQMKFCLPKTYKFHQKQNVHVNVDLIRVIR